MNPIIAEKLKKIQLLALDVDGVLTDGGIYIDEEGRQVRRFNMQDGYGLRLIQDQGIKVAIVTKATSIAVRHRADMLGIKEVHLGTDDKLAEMKIICEKTRLTLDQVAFMGDDLIDVELLSAVGFPAAPSNAVPQVRNHVVYVTQAKGGDGAVRELCDLLLAANQAE